MIKDIQRRFSQGLEVYSIMTATVSTMTATFFNYPKKVATMLWNGRQPWCRICILFIRSVFLFESLSLFTENTEVSFNPLFIRSVFLLKEFLWRVFQVLCMFQSLIHQVSVSFGDMEFGYDHDPEKFQSLIHQVSVSFLPSRYPLRRPRGGKVSIPYSSGQCFFSGNTGFTSKDSNRFNPLFIRSVFLFNYKFKMLK